MPATALTDRFLASLSGNGERQEFQDTKVRGLVMRVAQSGSPKSWSYVYRRHCDGKRQRVTIGSYPALTLANARNAAQSLAGEIARGEEPAAKRRNEASKSLTVANLIEQYVARRTATLRSADGVRWRLDKFVRHELATTQVSDLHRREVALLLDRLAHPSEVSGKTRRGTPALANRVYDDVRAMSAWAVSVGYLEADPLSALKRPAEKRSRDRVLSSTEIKVIFERLDTAKMSNALRRMIRLLWVTGCRASEIAELRKAEIDLASRCITLPPERVKNGRKFVIPLVAEAVSVLTEALADVGPEEAAVFPSPTGGSSIEGHALSVAVRRNLAHFGAGQWTPHDIRRSFATHIGDLGVQPHVIEVALNHVSGFRRNVTNSVYNRATYQREHRQALELWVAHLATIRAGQGEAIPSEIIVPC